MTNLIENSFALSTKLLKKDLRRTREKESVVGYLNISYNNKLSILDYRVEYGNEATYLVVVFGVEPQKILLSEQELIFGTRTFLTCGCGKRTNTLYLNKGVFACRKCHRLQYQSTTINRNSRHGRFLYQQSQIIKLMTEREQIHHIFYRSRYTKRFIRWLELCGKAGLTDEIEEANRLMVAINSQ